MLRRMKTRAFKKATLVRCIAASMMSGVSGAALSCVDPGGRAFLANRTSIDVTEAPICGAMVVDHEQCRPGDFGGVPWTKAPSFPPFSVPERLVRDRDDPNEERIIEAVRAHYLASPFYAGDIHSVCKSQVDSDAFPSSGTNLQRYELSQILKDRAVEPLASRVRKMLDDRDPSNSWALTSRFHNSLMHEVHDRVQAKLLWFVTRYPGGLPDISRERVLRRCVQETRDNTGAQLVTGVAGYIVLDNRIDTAIASPEVVYRALEHAMLGHSDITLDREFKQSLGMQWQHQVSKVANIRMARQDATAVAWPMWVQLQ